MENPIRLKEKASFCVQIFLLPIQKRLRLDKTISACCAYAAEISDLFHPTEIYIFTDLFCFVFCLMFSFKLIPAYHVAFKDVVHDLVSWKPCTVDEELKGELQPRIHFSSASLTLTFLSSFLYYVSK